MTDTFVFIDPAGVATDMSLGADGIFRLWGSKGGYMPPIRRTREPVAGQPGSRLQSIEHDYRKYELPVAIEAANETAFEQLMGNVVHRLDPRRGDGLLRHTRNDGGVRDFPCRYAEGLELDESLGQRTSGRVETILLFEGDPYWYDTAEQSKSWTAPGAPVPLFEEGVHPLIPVRLNASNVFGETTVIVVGDVLTWPVWVIGGPGSQIALTNQTTSKTFVWNGSLGSGESLIIDTRPGVKSVEIDDGTGQRINARADVVNWQLWPLESGTNEVSVSMSASDAASSIFVAWRNAYLAP